MPPAPATENNGQSPRRFQMRVVTTSATRQAFLDLCSRQNLVPNRVLGKYIESVVRRGRP
jgi:hypothetical protein